MVGMPHWGKRPLQIFKLGAASQSELLVLPETRRRVFDGCCGCAMPSPLCAALPAASALLLLLLLLPPLPLYWRSVVLRVTSSASEPEVYTFDVVNEYPHDPSAFTEGLLYVDNDTLFESTGLYGESSVRKVHLTSGKVQEFYRMDDSWFGEGLTLLGDRLFQVTWLKKTGFIYDRQNLNKLGSFTHNMTDGWGLATDGRIIFGSDGTSTLYELDPQNFEVIKRSTVRYRDYEVQYLNELEYIHGDVWANVFQTDCIARISPENGKVLSWVLLPELRLHLLASGYTGIDVLNGIAWDGDKKRLFVTGKLWPKLYEIKLHPVNGFSPEQIVNLCKPY